jgi:protein TonB
MKAYKGLTVLRSIVVFSLAVGIGAAEGAPKKISMNEAVSAATTKVAPEYPALAKQLKISGAVELSVVIGENGSVESVSPVSGNPVLTKPAAEAVKKWKFKPFVEGGSPVKAEAAMKFNFSN